VCVHMSFSDGRRRSVGTVQATGAPKSKTAATFKRDGGATLMQHFGATTWLVWRHQQNDGEQVAAWCGSMSKLGMRQARQHDAVTCTECGGSVSRVEWAAATSLLLEAASVSTGSGVDAMKESDLQYNWEDMPDWMLELERVHGGGQGANTKLLLTGCPNLWKCISLLEIST
jgi:hypothetical protein